MTVERLTAVDTNYLTIEEPRMPLHVASLGIFEAGPLLDEDGALRLDDVRKRIAARLDLIPRLRQRVMRVPFEIARPVWVDDEQFDIAHHVDVTELSAPHDEEALLRLTEDVVMTPLDTERPLWHLRFVTGIEGDRVALIERAHHAMVDGVSGVDISMVLLDTTRDPPEPVEADWVAEPTPSPLSLVVGGVADRVGASMGAMARSVPSVVHPTSMASGARSLASSLRTLSATGLRAPTASINQQIGSSRDIHLLRERLDQVQKVGHSAGGTVNDVVLTAVAGGMRALFLSRGESLPSDRTIKVLVPVSLRAASDPLTLGNRVGALLVALPIGIGDPHARLAAVTGATKDLKASPEATSVDLLLQTADLLPPRIADAVGRSVTHQPLVNTVVTNIPGPAAPLYAMGARMLEAFPIVPLGGNMDVEVAVLSYDGALTLGITSDRETCPDVDVFVAGIEQSFCDLGARWSPAVTSR